MKRALLGAVVVGMLALAVGAWRLRRVRRVVERPNIVLIIGCTVRRDQLGAYGAAPDASPYLSSRAKAGTVFDNGVSAAPWTKAASSAIVSGFHPATIGMVEPGPKPSRRRLSDAVHTLAEHFQDGGYQTFGATANPNLNEIFGFGQGFDAYVEGTRLWRLGGKAKVHGNELVDESMKVLRTMRNRKRPLFVQVMFTDAHAPAKVTPGELARVHQDGVPPRVTTYRAMLARFDRAVQLLVQDLRTVGIKPKNTVYVVVNDHGEGLLYPEHHGLGHGNLTYPSTTRMPWILWGTGVPRGHRVGGLASQIDVFPTLAGLAGLVPPKTDGLDWSAQVHGTSRTTRRLAFVDTWFQRSRRSAVYSETAHCHGDWSTSTVGCFSDEAATKPVPADAERRALEAFRERMEGGLSSWPNTVDAEPPASLQEQLEALGYVEGGEGAGPASVAPSSR